MAVPRFEGKSEWKQTLEVLGPEVVAMALMGSPGSPHGDILIGPAPGMTRGFVQEWLADKKREQAGAENQRQDSLVKAGKNSARAAIAAAVAAFIAAAAACVQAYTSWKAWEVGAQSNETPALRPSQNPTNDR
jgi:hypothetical protein